jgi:1-phosphofructokinase/tagatose 6-phosphate kinase
MPGGKGINVARSLRRLSEPVIATGLAGGRAGTQITDGLDAEGIVNDFVRIGAESRTSTAVVDPTSGLQTEINEYGPEVTADEVAALLEKVRYLAAAVSTVVLAGSLPRRVETSFYADLIRELSRRKVRTVIDTEGEPLRLALAAEPSLVFPNQREAEALVGNEFQTDEDFQAGLATIAAMGAGGVLVTLKTGCYALLSEGKGRRQMYRAWIPRIEAVSAVGSGDAFLAGFVAARYNGRPTAECLAYGVACGAESTQHLGAGLVDPDRVERLVGDVEVKRLELPAEVP